MSLPSHVDAALASIQTAGRSLARRERNELERARFNLWKSLDRRDLTAAAGWLGAVRLNALVIDGPIGDIVGDAVDVLTGWVDGYDSDSRGNR